MKDIKERLDALEAKVANLEAQKLARKKELAGIYRRSAYAIDRSRYTPASSPIHNSGR